MDIFETENYALPYALIFSSWLYRLISSQGSSGIITRAPFYLFVFVFCCLYLRVKWLPENFIDLKGDSPEK
jgi:uncharacterized membrane protein